MMIKNVYCDSKTLKNEASVEKNFVDRLIEDLGYEDADVRVKTSLKEIKIGKGSKSEIYKPDYIVFLKNVPVIVVDAKDPKEDVDNWTLQCSSYCLELNKKFDYNPVRYYIISNGLKTSVYEWDKEEPVLTLAFADFVGGNQKYKGLKALVSKKRLSKVLDDEREDSDQKLFPFDEIALEKLFATFQRILSTSGRKKRRSPVQYLRNSSSWFS